MTFEETRAVLTLLKSNYPQSFQRWTKQQANVFLALWSKGLEDEDLNIVLAAVWHFIADTDREFAPPLGVVRNYINSTPRYYLEADADKLLSSSVIAQLERGSATDRKEIEE